MADGHGRVRRRGMDILITALIVGIIGLSVLPFFLLSSAFGAPKPDKKAKDQNDGAITPVPADAGGPFPGMKKHDSSKDTGSDDGSDGGDGGGGAD
jgi:hypothetical protein